MCDLVPSWQLMQHGHSVRSMGGFLYFGRCKTPTFLFARTHRRRFCIARLWEDKAMEFEIAISILVALFIGFALGYCSRELVQKKAAP